MEAPTHEEKFLNRFILKQNKKVNLDEVLKIVNDNVASTNQKTGKSKAPEKVSSKSPKSPRVITGIIKQLKTLNTTRDNDKEQRERLKKDFLNDLLMAKSKHRQIQEMKEKEANKTFNADALQQTNPIELNIIRETLNTKENKIIQLHIARVTNEKKFDNLIKNKYRKILEQK